MKVFRRFSMIFCLALFLGGEIRGEGVAILKEQVFHRDSTAVAVLYEEIIDSNGPYLRIVNGRKSQNVYRSKLVDRIEIPDAIPDFIDSEAQVEPLRKSVDEMQVFGRKYTKSVALLESRVAALEAHIELFEKGKIRFEGSWMAGDVKQEIVAKRRAEAAVEERIEIEKRIFYAAQRDKGLVLHRGKWLTKKEIDAIPATASSPLSECILPVMSGDLTGARFAVSNLNALAAGQTGAVKVRTERLCAMVKNLFKAESRLVDLIVKGNAVTHELAVRERNAKAWEEPNFFGTINENAAAEARKDAKRLAEEATEMMASAEENVLFQLREAEKLMADFHALGELRVVLILDATIQKVAGRHFTEEEFAVTFPREILEEIRVKLRQAAVGEE